MATIDLPVELKERVEINPLWHHGDGERWTFHSELLIDGVTLYLNMYGYTVSDIVGLIKEEKLDLSDDNIKDIARFAHAITKEPLLNKPTKSAHEAYYG